MNTDTIYARRPFIAHDGGTDQQGTGAEVGVRVGRLPLLTVTPVTTAEGILRVNLDHSAAGLTHPISATIPTSETRAVEVLREAWRAKQPITFRIESQRHAWVDRSLPWSECAKQAGEMLGSRLVGVAVGEGEMVYTTEALTNPKEDPVSGGVSALGQPARTGHANADDLLEQYREATSGGYPESITGALAAIALMKGASVDDLVAASAESVVRRAGLIAS